MHHIYFDYLTNKYKILIQFKVYIYLSGEIGVRHIVIIMSATAGCSKTRVLVGSWLDAC